LWQNKPAPRGAGEDEGEKTRRCTPLTGCRVGEKCYCRHVSLLLACPLELAPEVRSQLHAIMDFRCHMGAAWRVFVPPVALTVVGQDAQRQVARAYRSRWGSLLPPALPLSLFRWLGGHFGALLLLTEASSPHASMTFVRPRGTEIWSEHGFRRVRFASLSSSAGRFCRDACAKDTGVRASQRKAGTSR
jgi:hypothetical protein